MIDDFRPDIVHIHSYYHHLSPAVLPEINKSGIPIVMNMGDFHMVAPNYNLFHSGRICEVTKPDKYWKAVGHRCVKNSYAASILEVAEKYFNRMTGWERNLVDCFIAPGQFMKDKLIEYGLPAEKISVLSHFARTGSFPVKSGGDGYILYFGRLSEEKGLEGLISVMKNLPEIRLKIAGKGDMEKKLKNKTREEGINNIEFYGFLEGMELEKAITGSRFTVLPSVWYEVFGLSILESFASGRPVVASRIGGIGEIIRDGYNGLLFEPGNKKQLGEKIKFLWQNKNECRRMGENALKTAREKFNSSSHYKNIMEIYKKCAA